MNNKEYSPFTPGSPVPVELFVGRSDQMKEMARYIKQALHKNQENAFLLGDRGIGKSSAASFLRYFAEKQENMIGIHIFLGGVSDLSDIVHHIFEQILKESKGQTWFENIRKFFGNYIREVGLFGISVSFTPSREDLRELTRKFPEALHNVLKELEGPSLMRIFRIVEIERLSDGEVEEFFHKAFDKANVEVRNEAVDIMVKYSSGLPILMHEIGEAVFWMDQDGIIDEEDALVGVLTAAERIGKKYLDPKVYRAIRSERYRSILRKLGQPISKCFTKKEIEKRLNESEKKVFHNFLGKLRDIGIIEQDVEKGRGAYRFVNEIYPVYIWIESERAREPLLKDLNSYST